MGSSRSSDPAPRAGDSELVVLLDEQGRPAGSARKGDVHHAPAPYHLAFSCYAFDAYGRLLMTRRAGTKRTWPGVWTNTCCGHPAPGEASEDALRRRVRDELGLQARGLVLADPDFSYRVRDGDVEEHELCPVYLARVDAEPVCDPAEVDEVAWWRWDELVDRVRSEDSPDARLSPWTRLQVPRLAAVVGGYLDPSGPANTSARAGTWAR